MKESITIADRALVAGERAWIKDDIWLLGGLEFDAQGNAMITVLYATKKALVTLRPHGPK